MALRSRSSLPNRGHLFTDPGFFFTNPFVASSRLQAITPSAPSGFSTSRFATGFKNRNPSRRIFFTDPESESILFLHSRKSQPVEATTIASSNSEFMDSNTLMLCCSDLDTVMG
ncbi:hypothetical protein LXL04_030108 [Taraxacum kok-saghyz]